MNPNLDQLTAYALGEGSPAERAAIEAHLATHPDAQAEVLALRASADLISDSLAQESTPGLDQARKDILAQLQHPGPGTTRLRFPTWLGVLATGAVAAGLVLAIAPDHETAPQKRAASAHFEPVASPALAETSIGLSAEQPRPATTSFMAEAPSPRAVSSAAEVASGIALVDGIAHAPLQAKPSEPEKTLLATRAAPTALSALSESFDGTVDGTVDGSVDGSVDGWQRASVMAVDINRLSFINTPGASAATAHIHGALRSRQLPPPATARTWDWLQAFHYRYAPPSEPNLALAIHADAGACPWNRNHRLIRIGITSHASDLGSNAGSLMKTAKDFVLRVEFAPATIAAWREVSAEKPTLGRGARSDELTISIGSNHNVTVLYEVEPADSEINGAWTVDLHWRLPDGSAGESLRVSATDAGGAGDTDTRFAAAVAEFAAVLRKDPGPWDLNRVLRTAQETAGTDARRLEFIELVRHAQHPEH